MDWHNRVWQSLGGRNKPVNQHASPGKSLVRRLVEAALPLGIAAAVGALLYSAAWLIKDRTFLGDLADQARDTALALRADNEPVRKLKYPIVFLNWDERSFIASGRREDTPSSAIAHLLQVAVAAGAKLIIVDFDLREHETADDRAVLNRALASTGSKEVPVLLVQQVYQSGAASGPLVLPALPFGGIDAQHGASWVSAEWVGSGGTVRRIQSWVETCYEGTPRYLVGVAPAVLALLDSAATHFSRADWRCDHGDLLRPHELVLAGKSVQLRLTNGDDSLVHYATTWHGEDTVSRQTLADGRPIVRAIGASELAGARADGSIEAMRGAIVLLGAAHSGGNDRVRTPLGEMPGGFVIVNHLRGFLDFGREQPQSFAWGLMVVVVMSVFTGLLVILSEDWMSGWGGLMLPIAMTIGWWLLSALVTGTADFLALALTQFVIALVTIAASRLKPLKVSR